MIAIGHPHGLYSCNRLVFEQRLRGVAGGQQPQGAVSGEYDPAAVEGPGRVVVPDPGFGMRELGLAPTVQLDLPDGNRFVGGEAREQQLACVGRPRNPAERSQLRFEVQNRHVGVGKSLDSTAERRHEKDPVPSLEVGDERDPATVGRPTGVEVAGIALDQRDRISARRGHDEHGRRSRMVTEGEEGTVRRPAPSGLQAGHAGERADRDRADWPLGSTRPQEVPRGEHSDEPETGESHPPRAGRILV